MVFLKGGNLILMNHIRNRLNLNNKIFAFDTFEGMSEPTIYDKDLKDVPADKTFEIYKQRDEKWCYGGLEEVKKNILVYLIKIMLKTLILSKEKSRKH